VPLVPTLTFQAVLADHGDKVGASAFLQDLFRREIAESSVMLRRAYDAGVPLLTGTESGFSITPYGEWHWRELQVFVEALGLTPTQALIAATREGAHAVGLEGKVGTLEPDRLADLIVVDGDPATDVTILGRPGAITHVWKGGRAVDIATPMPERRPLPSWRVSTYSAVPATRVATGVAPPAPFDGGMP
jgi:imidazolonepropionase-like amidohydrolase